VTGPLAVVVKGVTRRYGPVWILRGVDATFAPGSLTVVEGANGAGKTTLLGIVGGLIQPTAGAVTWGPDGSWVGERRDAIGWVGHESFSYRELTAAENVAIVATAHGVGRARVAQSLERVGATGLANRRVGTLSRGQKQRVALARSIVHAPDLLLLDEPFTGLDTKGCEKLEDVLRQERQRGAIIVVVSHDRGLSARLESQSLYVERGRVKLVRPESTSACRNEFVQG
jgi:heme ABC exporter ATP-binding subunit CcmA